MFSSLTRRENCTCKSSCGSALVIIVQKLSLAPTCSYWAVASGCGVQLRFLLPTRFSISNSTDLLKWPRGLQPHHSSRRFCTTWTRLSPIALQQMSASGPGCWRAAPREPWRWPLPSPQTWSKSGSRLRFVCRTVAEWRGTAARWRPTGPSPGTRASKACGKVKI